MPRSILLGRQRRSVTRYRYDAMGRLVESVTEHDPEWTEEDLAAALDWLRDKRLRCTCGHRKDETMRPERWNDWDADVAVCNACAQADRAMAAAIEKSSENKPPPGAKVRTWER